MYLCLTSLVVNNTLVRSLQQSINNEHCTVNSFCNANVQGITDWAGIILSIIIDIGHRAQCGHDMSAVAKV